MLADINGIKLYCRAEGEGLPLLFVHAFPLDGRMWEAQLRALAGDYRVLVPDLRGFGQTEAPDGTYTMDLLAEDLRALLDYLNVERAVFCGLSMGGYIGLAFARRYPERLAALVLADTRVGADTEEARGNRNRLIELARERGADAIADQHIPKMFAATTYTDQPDLIIRARDIMASQPERGIVGALQGLRDRLDSIDMLAQIRTPTLVIVGNEDQLTPPSEAELLQSLIPGSRLELILHAGHLSNMEQPEDFTQVLRSFVDPLQASLLQQMR